MPVPKPCQNLLSIILSSCRLPCFHLYFREYPSLTVIHSPELKIIDHLRTSAPVDPKAPNFHSVTTNLSEGSLFGELEPKDTEWLCAGGFVTETQTFYTVTEDGQFLNCQIIHSSVG